LVSAISSFTFLDENSSNVYAYTETSDQFKTFYDYNSGIKIQYPMDWINGDPDVITPWKTEKTANISIIAMFYPSDFSGGVAVAVEKQSKNFTLEEELQDTIRSLEKSQPSIHLVESNKTIISGLPGYMFIYKGEFDLAKSFEKFGLPRSDLDMFTSTRFQQTSVNFMTIHNGLIYSISLELFPSLETIIPGALSLFGSTLNESTPTDTNDKLSQYLPIVQKMVNSFEITNLNENNGTQNQIIPEQIGDEKCNDYVDILKSRLVKGEITKEEFVEHKKIIEC
jgi:hypothetical protein